MAKLRQITYTSTSTGQTSSVTFPGGYQYASAVINNPTTLPVDWHMEASMGGNAWWAIHTATTSTGYAAGHSTLLGVFDRVRMDIEGNDQTSTCTGVSWVVGVY